jgi:AcrR family transcriptional regulator
MPRAPSASRPSDSAAPATGGVVRLRRADREREIVQGAIQYFADVGFAGDTTGLARQLGVAQPLLYRYFQNKEALIERVFQETFLSNWNPLWEEMILAPEQAVAQRLLEFHRDFARVHLRRERVRLSLFFALHGWDMSPYFRVMRQRVYEPIALSLRQYTEAGRDGQPFAVQEIELAKTVVEKIQYHGIRQWVYGLPVPEIDPVIQASVASLLDGVGAVLGKPAAKSP